MFYQDQIVPLLINWSMRQRNLTAYRSRIVPAAEGRVLEIGIGSRTQPAILFAQRSACSRPRTVACLLRLEGGGPQPPVEDPAAAS
jgi:hypothetical protein